MRKAATARKSRKCNAQHGCAYKVAGYGSGNCSSIIILQDCFCLNQSPTHVQQRKSTSGTWNSSYIHVCTLKRTSQSCKSLVGLSKFFSLETLLTAHPNSGTINWFVENWEACLLPSALQLTCCQVSCWWLVCLLDHKHKGKGMCFNSQQPIVGRSIAWQCQKWLCSRLGPKGLKDEFWLYKVEKMFYDSAFTAVKRDESSKQGNWKGYLCQ